MIREYRITTLCGSTRFKDAFMDAQKRLTLEGHIVISVGLFGHSGDSEVWEGMDEILSRFLRKIIPISNRWLPDHWPLGERQVAVH